MAWTEIFLVLALSHLVGDFVLQTDWQARHKYGGLGADATARAALLRHVALYTLAFVPALVWLADDLGGWTLVVAAGVAVPHLIQDDGRLLTRYMAIVKGPSSVDAPLVTVAVDQTLHALALFVVAVLAAA